MGERIFDKNGPFLKRPPYAIIQFPPPLASQTIGHYTQIKGLKTGFPAGISFARNPGMPDSPPPHRMKIRWAGQSHWQKAVEAYGRCAKKIRTDRRTHRGRNRALDPCRTGAGLVRRPGVMDGPAGAGNILVPRKHLRTRRGPRS